MNISLNDFNVLSSDLSRRDVQIALLEMKLQQEREKRDEEVSQLKKEVDALLAENVSLRDELSQVRTDFENVRFENHWMRQYIMLSVDRVREFFSHIRDFQLLSAVKSFVLEVLPPNATPEQKAFTLDAMRLQMPQEPPQIVIEHAVDVIATGGVKNVNNTVSHD